MEYVIQDLVKYTSMQASLASGHHAMGEHRACNMFYVIGDDIGAPMNSCIGLGSAIECECSTRTYAKFDTGVYTRCPHQFDDVTFDARLDAHPANDLLQAL